MDYNQTQLEILQEIQSLRSAIDKVSGFIAELKSDYEVLEEKIELNSSDVMRILGVSRASLARWREANAVPFRYVSANHVVIVFERIMGYILRPRDFFCLFSSCFCFCSAVGAVCPFFSGSFTCLVASLVLP